jgi:hypothetical protein
MKENLFSANKENPIADRQSKEDAVQTLLGSDDVDVSKADDEELARILTGLGTITTENIDRAADEIIGVMRELKANNTDILEALQTHLHVHLAEAKEILVDAVLRG